MGGVLLMIEISWKYFKEGFVNNPLFYTEFDRYYIIWVSVNGATFYSYLSSPEDKSEFEGSFKSKAISTAEVKKLGTDIEGDRVRQSTRAIIASDSTPDTWFEILAAPYSGDKLRIKIEALPEVVIPFDDVEAYNKIKAADKVVSYFNKHPSYCHLWTSTFIREGNRVFVYITALAEGYIGERTNPGSFSVETIGTNIAVTIEYDNIIRRAKDLTLTRDDVDPRRGVLLVDEGVKDNPVTNFVTNLTNDVAKDMNVDGSDTPVNFGFYALDNYDVYIREIRIFGSNTSQIKMDNFLGESALTTGLTLTMQSVGQSGGQMCAACTTSDFLNKFASSISDFTIFNEGKDNMLAVQKFRHPLVIKSKGTYVYDDNITITVGDDLSGLDALECILIGNKVRVGG